MVRYRVLKMGVSSVVFGYVQGAESVGEQRGVGYVQGAESVR